MCPHNTYRSTVKPYALEGESGNDLTSIPLSRPPQSEPIDSSLQGSSSQRGREQIPSTVSNHVVSPLELLADVANANEQTVHKVHSRRSKNVRQ